MKATFLLALSFLLVPVAALAQREIVPGPDPGTRRFGADIIVLPNDNYLVTDPDWSAGAGADRAGAVYFYAADGTLLSRLAGSAADDAVGSGGIVVLPGGDFVVQSPQWRAPGGLAAAGAVTWGDRDSGFGPEATIDAGNSLVGGSAGDRIGADPVVVLADGSYVVASGDWDRPGVAVDAGAVTRCAADGSTTGLVTDANSLVGSQPGDRVGGRTLADTPGVVALANGHYVVASPFWDHGATVDAGAVTWGAGDGSVIGPVGVANSLVGAQAGDFVGTEVQALANGHYFVQSWLWDAGATTNVGAVTWRDGSGPGPGVVTAANSLVGSQTGDRVGFLAAVLDNGHYVVASPLWNNGPVGFAGAVTWRDGSGANPAVVSPANSLVGTRFGDSIGYFTTIGIAPLGVVPLPGGDYVVASPEWNRSETLGKVGAATWGDGNGGTVGPVGPDNSLVGALANDAIAQYVIVLEDGSFVVASPYWSQRRGAASWGNGPLAGEVGPANSLVGERTTDFVTANGVYPLPDGGFAVPTPRWGRDDAASLGAVTRAAPGVGVVGPVSAANSYTGTLAGDLAGSGGLVGLPDGDLLVRSALSTSTGSLTRIPAATPPGAAIAAGNSLVGRPDDRIGGPGPSVMPDGAIVSFSATAALDGAGAITLFRAGDRFRGGLPEIDTVRSAIPGGGTSLNYAYREADGLLLVGDPAGNRVIRLRRSRLFADGFE